MLRESGSLRLATRPPPPPFPLSSAFSLAWQRVAANATEHTHKEQGRHVGQIGDDSQSDWFKYCDLSITVSSK